MGFLSNLFGAPAQGLEDDLAQVRTKARRRLIGAAVLLAIGVIGFPLLFETQPRPTGVDVPTVIARKDTPSDTSAKVADRSAADKVVVDRATGAAAPPEMIVEKASESGREVVPMPKPADKPVAKPAVVEPAVKAPAKEPVKESVKEPVKEPVKEAAKALTKEPVKEPAKSPTKDVAVTKPANQAAAKPASDPVRYIVQVGAFANDSGVREARQKLERAGVKSYTQVVKTADGRRTRVRAGPFGSRDEADKAAGKAKAAGLTPSVMTLD
jgi:DedD protein